MLYPPIGNLGEKGEPLAAPPAWKRLPLPSSRPQGEEGDDVFFLNPSLKERRGDGSSSFICRKKKGGLLNFLREKKKRKGFIFYHSHESLWEEGRGTLFRPVHGGKVGHVSIYDRETGGDRVASFSSSEG